MGAREHGIIELFLRRRISEAELTCSEFDVDVEQAVDRC